MFHIYFSFCLPLQQIIVILTFPVDFKIRVWLWLRLHPIVRKDVEAGLAGQMLEQNTDTVIFVGGCERRGARLRRVLGEVVVEVRPLTE